MNQYIGHPSQLFGMEEHQLTRGKGKGLRLIEIHNGKGLDLCVSPDRCADIPRLRYKGINLSYMNPCGYVAPAFYDKEGETTYDSIYHQVLDTQPLLLKTIIDWIEIRKGLFMAKKSPNQKISYDRITSAMLERMAKTISESSED